MTNREGYIEALRAGGWPKAETDALAAMTETEWCAFLNDMDRKRAEFRARAMERLAYEDAGRPTARTGRLV